VRFSASACLYGTPNPLGETDPNVSAVDGSEPWLLHASSPKLEALLLETERNANRRIGSSVAI
jgi:hypothetical protein